MRIFSAACTLTILAALSTALDAQTVSGVMQPRPGDKAKLIEAPVRQAPIGLPFVAADQVNLANRELVVGISRGDESWAFPVRYLGMFEIVNSHLGSVPVAPTW